MLAAGIRMRKASPPKNRPNMNLPGAGGSLFPRASHSHAKTGASAITKTGCTVWYQLAGKSKPRMLQLVNRSANRFSEEPACSNAAQNSADATNSTRIAAHRFRSTADQSPKKISQENTTTEIPRRHQPRPVE